MVTRFYLSSNFFTTTTTSYSPSWEETASAVRSYCYSYKSDSTNNNYVVTHSIASIADVLAVQYISEPLDGYQVISGTCKGSIKVFESVATNDCRAQLVIKIVSNDGYSTRGFLLSENNSALSNEFGTSSSTRRFPLNWISPGTTLNSLAGQDGDRVVIEIGVRFHTTSTGITATLALQDISGTSDLGETEGSTVVANPWIELSQTLSFKRENSLATTYSDGYKAYPEIQIQGNLANLCGTQESSTISYFVMRGTDIDCPGPTPTYRTWTVTGDPDTTGFYYFGTKCGGSPLMDIVIIKELLV